ncbi:LPP20 family lipoprotein [Desulfobacter latus]|uniref:Lipoprotein n=1 Tax=Desulfobacter latus TaxID=2292 RepID=A0A850T2R8_9BACT|nr:hypothetical protein [Desulfobacter latus]NWH06023.1 hypothetical protein [Desulfobacter latus]
MKKGSALSVCLIALSLWGCSNGRPGAVLDSSVGSRLNHRVVTFRVTGKGLEPENALTKGEAILMAERAAVVDGYRQLVEKIRGVYVDAYTKAGRGSVSEDEVQVYTQSWLRGAEVMDITQGEYGITLARLRLRINFSKKGMIWWPVSLADQG